MRVEPISSSLNTTSNWDITPLLPKSDPKPKSVVDILPKPQSVNDIFNILTEKLKMEMVMIQFKGIGGQEEDGESYEHYLQFPNAQISALASTIVNPGDSNDTKMFKIEQWVKENITYQSDEKTYGQGELWAYPTMTLEKRVGDCEDGAFLMHSLALAAGVPSDRLRTYGGLVWGDEYGLTTGGHAWTTYKRETDDQWIITDWCYWPTNQPMSEREPMKNHEKYIDDWFYVSANKTVESPYANYVRNPVGLFAQQEKGLLLNTMA